MALSKGDKVQNVYNIKGGVFGSDIKANTDGKVLSVSYLFDNVDVEFVVNGVKKTVRDIPLKDVKKV